MIARWNFERYENKMFTAFQRLAARHADITQVKSYALASSNASFFPDNGPGEAMVEIEVPWYIYGSSFSRELFIFKVRGTRIESVERVVHTGAL